MGSCVGGRVRVSGALKIVRPIGEEPKEEATKGQKRSAEASSSQPAKKAKAEASKPAAKAAADKAKTVEFSDTPKAKAKAQAPQVTSERQVGSKYQLGSGMMFELLKTGNGPTAAKGKMVQVRYEGRLAKTGKRFDKGAIKFKLGKGEVIRGWDLGVVGMQRNERRRLLIPAALGYGASGAPPDIPRNADLVFEVELLQC